MKIAFNRGSVSQCVKILKANARHWTRNAPKIQLLETVRSNIRVMKRRRIGLSKKVVDPTNQPQQTIERQFEPEKTNEPIVLPLAEPEDVAEVHQEEVVEEEAQEGPIADGTNVTVKKRG
jgi:hypothetical protein